LTNRKKTAVILINLGTPDEPSSPAIKRYLAEFLSDPRVVNLPRSVWLPILYGAILTVRPKRLVPKYQMVWGTYDGPIRNITAALARLVHHQFKKQQPDRQITITSAMTYGNPSIASVIDQLSGEGFDDFLFIPLFPQYSSATTGAVFDQITRALRQRTTPTHRFLDQYHQHTAYIHALTKSVEAYNQQINEGAHLVFSFHGIPESQSAKGDPYYQQCQATAERVAHALTLEKSQWQVSFQSRFGPAEWLKPYTSDVMAELPGQGKKNLLVICPGFAVDCLETIEEIKLLNRDIFLTAGGEKFRYIKALNATKDHVELISALINQHS
jgi:protoporphyrin/coproporphyrin ferrochelatase